MRVARAALLGDGSTTYGRLSAHILMAGTLPHLRYQHAEHRDFHCPLSTRESTPCKFEASNGGVRDHEKAAALALSLRAAGP